MESKRANRRLIAIVGFGVIFSAVAIGVRLTHRKPVHGLWMGYSYINVDGSLRADKDFGQYIIRLEQDGTYHENGNWTSGQWVQKGDHITLTPTKFYDLTPDEHRRKQKMKGGKASVTIERLLALRMKPMTVMYIPGADHLIYKEPTLHFEYERYR